jgi:Methyltransferase domain
MESSESVLVLVGHPNEETIGFSSVCVGADVVSATDGSWGGHAAARRYAFKHACEILRAQHARLLDLPDISPWRLPIDMLIDRLRALGPYGRVYTHSPFEAHVHQRDVVLAASQCFEQIWVRSLGGYATEVHVLDRQAYQRKVEIMNSIYPATIPLCGQDPHCMAGEALADIAGIESFVPVRWSQVHQALALTNPEIRAELPNTWAFEVSLYEIER